MGVTNYFILLVLILTLKKVLKINSTLMLLAQAKQRPVCLQGRRTDGLYLSSVQTMQSVFESKVVERSALQNTFAWHTLQVMSSSSLQHPLHKEMWRHGRHTIKFLMLALHLAHVVLRLEGLMASVLSLKYRLYFGVNNFCPNGKCSPFLELTLWQMSQDVTNIHEDWSEFCNLQEFWW